MQQLPAVLPWPSQHTHQSPCVKHRFPCFTTRTLHSHSAVPRSWVSHTPKSIQAGEAAPGLGAPAARDGHSRPPPVWPRPPSPPPSALASRWHLHDQYAARSRRAPGCYHQGRVTKQLHSPLGAGGWERQALGLVKNLRVTSPHTWALSSGSVPFLQ